MWDTFSSILNYFKKSPSELYLPTEELIIAMNKHVLIAFKDKNSDRHELYSREKLQNIIRLLESYEGDIYRKALILLKELTIQHVFASGNRRTAMYTTMLFLEINDAEVLLRNDPEDSNTLLGIRNVRTYYTDDELIMWLKKGTIKKYVKPYGKQK
jgi:death-on-curing family protein